jgi:hypothetical protein
VAASIALAACGAGAGEGAGGGGEAAVTPGGTPGAELQGSDDQQGAAGAGEGGKSSTDANRGAGTALLQEQKLIQTSSLGVEVGDVPKAVRAAEDKVLAAGGRIQSEQTSSEQSDESGSGSRSGSDDDRITSADLVLRVPPDAYERVLRDLAGLGRLLSQGRDTKDVTQKFVDVQSRIETQRASLDRVRALLSRATKIGDIVSIESELTRREADLESLLAQQKTLAEQTDLATINMHLVASSQEPAQKEEKETELGFLAGLRNGWDAFTGFLGVLLLVVGALLPFAAAGLAVTVATVLVIRRLRPSRPTPATTTEPPSAA